jgi:hypothetical protein
MYFNTRTFGHSRLQIILKCQVLSCWLRPLYTQTDTGSCYLFSCLVIHFWDKISLCTPGWPQICSLPASASQMLGLQECTTAWLRVHFMGDSNTMCVALSLIMVKQHLMDKQCLAKFSTKQRMNAVWFLSQEVPRKDKFTKMEGRLKVTGLRGRARRATA